MLRGKICSNIKWTVQVSLVQTPKEWPLTAINVNFPDMILHPWPHGRDDTLVKSCCILVGEMPAKTSFVRMASNQTNPKLHLLQFSVANGMKLSD